jgi:carbamoyltransferase
MHVLGVSCYFHDSAAALLRDGTLVAAAEEERFSRLKHDYEFPIRAIDFCLRQGGLAPGDLDYVVFFEKPFLKFERLLLSILQTFPRSGRVFRQAMITWLGDKLWIQHRLKRHFGLPASRILFSEHHLSHAASAFFCSPYEEAAVLTVDGVGEWATASLGVGRGSELRLLREIHFPHSLGLLYSAFTAFLGFEVNEGEYKVMGMAPFGRPRFADDVRRLVRIAPDGSFALDMDYFDFHHSSARMFSRKFVERFGPPRAPDAPVEDPRYADLAASVQLVTEEVLLALARAAHRETGLRRLCLAGGCALNSVANARILRETPFEELYIQPAAGDGGGALGAALYAVHALLGRPRRFVMEHASWGEAHADAAVEACLAAEGVTHERFDDEARLIARVVDDLQAGRVVGWSQGRFEWGPRALGHRSILADPRRAEMKDVVNTKIKYREPFRPFAPSVLTDRAEEFFALPEPGRHYPARFMLYVTDVRPARRDLVPAVTHCDGTARLQTVDRRFHPRYHRLIETFGEATGVPVLLNTSFNLRGEPMVNTPAEALGTFRRSEMDVLVLGDRVVRKRP